MAELKKYVVNKGDIIKLPLKAGYFGSHVKDTEIGRIICKDRKFLVTNVCMRGGGTGMGPHDIFPDGLSIHAIMLTENDEYDEDGKVIDFYLSGCFIDDVMAKPEDIKVVGKMKQHWSIKKGVLK